MDIVSFVEGLLAKTDLVENPINRTHNYTIRESDPEHWAARVDIANELHAQFQHRYPKKLVDMDRGADGPGSYLIVVKIKDNPFN